MKKAKFYYSAPVSHPEIPGAYLCTFGLTNMPPEWVMERGDRKVFASKDEAEIAGYRAMMLRLNRASGSQTPTLREPIRVTRDFERRTPRPNTHAEDVSRVFARFPVQKKDELRVNPRIDPAFKKIFY